MNPDHADLAERVASQGPAAVETELRRFIREARMRHATPLLVAILADPAQPEVARQRAFGRLCAEIDQLHRSTAAVPSDHDTPRGHHCPTQRSNRVSATTQNRHRTPARYAAAQGRPPSSDGASNTERKE
jgi:hypothetical protein